MGFPKFAKLLEITQMLLENMYLAALPVGMLI